MPYCACASSAVRQILIFDATLGKWHVISEPFENVSVEGAGAIRSGAA